MQSRLQKENVSRYYHEKMALCKEIGLDFEECKEQVATGLISRELSTFILSRTHKDEVCLYQDLINYERIGANRRNRFAEVEYSGEQSQGGKNTQLTKNEVRVDMSVVEKEKGHRFQSVRCYNCNRFGHVSNRCDKPIRPKGSCYNCGSMDHQRLY